VKKSRYLLWCYLFLSVVLVIGMVLASCAKQTSTTASTTSTQTTTSQTTQTSTTQTSTTKTTSTSTSTATQTTGGVLRIASAAGINLNFGDPARTWQSIDPGYAAPAVEYLVTAAPDGSGKPYPLLATGWQYSSDYTSLTFTLRKNVKFHDGTDFNAQAAKFCLDLMKTTPRTELKSVKSIDVVDEYTIKFNLSSYSPGFLYGLIGFPTMMVSPTNYQKVGADKAAFAPVGTGPFKFDSYTPSVSVKFTRFDGYWGGKAYLDGIEWVLMNDQMTALAALKSGQIDATRTISQSDYADLIKTPGYAGHAFTALVQGFLGDSAHASSPFSDIRVRQAVTYALDRPSIASAIFFGAYEPANQIVPQKSWAYDSTATGYPFDQKQAKINLALAGYTTGLNTTLLYNQSTTRDQVFTSVKAQLKEVGINVDLKSSQNMNPTLASGWNNSLCYFEMPVSIETDLGQKLGATFSSQSTYINPNSLSIPPEYDAKLLAVLGEHDSTTYQKTVKGLVKDIIDNYCMVFPLYFVNSTMVQHDYVHDFDWQIYANTCWQPAKAWMSKH
jgi:peptide/nickel transport system substrate-binding protein